MKNIENRLADRNISLKMSDKALQWVVDNGYDEVYGARPLKRLLKKELENKLAYAILSGAIKDGDVVMVDVDKDGLTVQ
jgi:ATP-dependent Clp protease ATP-binding subunit ClpB